MALACHLNRGCRSAKQRFFGRAGVQAGPRDGSESHQMKLREWSTTSRSRIFQQRPRPETCLSWLAMGGGGGVDRASIVNVRKRAPGQSLTQRNLLTTDPPSIHPSIHPSFQAFPPRMRTCFACIPPSLRH
ncbi:uncharacterized protein BO80DRAFT_219889 [Aspergillus ibericus CBS 121593]|uniref:Uncharacterized protein n=1 Tax=Aspergillus ibericus CBS 121593 TaxID=1448316 RepID=A0A395GNT3_9EURO|nr:hypothetical protein BO80DRAFT_219889 [Aspergillus ibericus CBS 121593]RAK96608.1 hypothetical protein BO80DRAFT_219889 [Aspergillus ibericus CBS 121593]